MLKYRLKKIVISSLFILLGTLYFPFAFSTGHKMAATNTPVVETKLGDVFSNENLAFVYDSLDLEKKGLSEDAFAAAVAGFEKLQEQGKIKNANVISIADFTKSSSKKRLFIIDIKRAKLLFNTYVAHGQNSGKEMAASFSNQPESYQSSPGFYITSDTYMGKNGFSMHLQGMEKGINDMAYERAIVMHGAPYVSENFIRTNGYLGRSWGCPAVPQELTKPIINTIKGGSCLFIYSENSNYSKRSKFLQS